MPITLAPWRQRQGLKVQASTGLYRGTLVFKDLKAVSGGSVCRPRARHCCQSPALSNKIKHKRKAQSGLWDISRSRWEPFLQFCLAKVRATLNPSALQTDPVHGGLESSACSVWRPGIPLHFIFSEALMWIQASWETDQIRKSRSTGLGGPEWMGWNPWFQGYSLTLNFLSSQWPCSPCRHACVQKLAQSLAHWAALSWAWQAKAFPFSKDGTG